MVSRAYLLDKSAPPSAAKRFFDQRAMPILIDAAGAVEQELERVAVTIRGAPLASMAVALGLGCLLRETGRMLKGRH